MKSHIASCASCAKEWESLNRALEAIAEAGQTEPPADFTEAVMARIAVESQALAMEQRRASNTAVVAAVAAMAVAVLVGLIVTWSVVTGLAGSPESVLVAFFMAMASCANTVLALWAMLRALVIAARNAPFEAVAAACGLLYALAALSLAIWANWRSGAAVMPREL